MAGTHSPATPAGSGAEGQALTAKHVIAERTYEMIWCPVFKAGSSNWLFLLCELHQLKNRCPIQTLRSRLGNIPHHWKVPASVRHRFLVVRHPFERLLSAFRDKIETNGRRPGQFYYTKAMRMARLHRLKDATPRPMSSAELYGPPPQPQPQPSGLTFPEFLRSVARQDVGDEHWKPYFAHCTPCNVDYDLIGKLETIEEDNRYIAAQLGIKQHVELLLPQLGNRNKRGPTSGNTKEKYFAQVTREELMNVHKMFQMDFIMFNYTVDEYLEYTKPLDSLNDLKSPLEQL